MIWSFFAFVIDYWFIIGFLSYWPMLIAYLRDDYATAWNRKRHWVREWATQTEPKVPVLGRVKVKHFFFAPMLSFGGPLFLLLALVFTVSAIWNTYEDEINAFLDRNVDFWNKDVG